MNALLCYNNAINDLNVSQNSELKELRCDNNQLSVLDISSNEALEYLSCGSNQLTALEVNKNTELEKLFCYLNEITDLDLTENSNLNTLDCWGNQLLCLNLQNGNNADFHLFYAKNNPGLTCIKVDDATWVENNWNDENYFKLDSLVSFNENCTGSCVSTGIAKIEKKVVKAYPNPFTSSTTIDFSNPSNERYILSLYDFAGNRLRYNENVTGERIQLSREDLPKGTYLLELSSASNIYEGRLMIN